MQGRYPIPSQKPGTNPFPSKLDILLIVILCLFCVLDRVAQRGYPSHSSFVPTTMENGIQLQPNPSLYFEYLWIYLLICFIYVSVNNSPNIVPQPNTLNSSNSNPSLERQQYEQKVRYI